MSPFFANLQCIACDEAGAVTTDWIALTSAVLLIGILTVVSIYNNGASASVDDVNEIVTQADGIDSHTAPEIDFGN